MVYAVLQVAKGLALVDLIRDVHALFMRVKFPSTVRCSVVTQLADLEYVLLLYNSQDATCIAACNIPTVLRHSTACRTSSILCAHLRAYAWYHYRACRSTLAQADIGTIRLSAQVPSCDGRFRVNSTMLAHRHLCDREGGGRRSRIGVDAAIDLR